MKKPTRPDEVTTITLPMREILLVCTWTVGWALLTYGVATAVHRWWVWPISTGLALLGVGGYKLLWIVLREGLYTLTQDEKQ